MATKASVFADLEGLPSSFGAGEIYSAMKPISKGLDLPANKSDREFKKKYDSSVIGVGTDGFTIFVSLNSHTSFEEQGGNGQVMKQRTPHTYFKFTIGETPTYSFYFGPDAPSYEMVAPSILVDKIIINKKSNDVKIILSEGVIKIKNKKFRYDKADAKGTQGFMFQEGVSDFPSMIISVAPYNQKTVQLYATALEDARNLLMPLIKDMNNDGEGIYVWNADSATVYLSPQSFTFDSTLDKEFLRSPSFDFDSMKPMDTKNSFIRFNCVIENTSLRTNNYTGFDPQDNSMYMTTLQFPGDEAGLAPMGTSSEGTEAACGLESSEGRVLKSIKPVISGTSVQQVKLEFHDGSFCIFPDAETGMFTATDKETGQELQGRVEGLIVAEGSWKESHTKEIINRISNNIDSKLTLTDSEGDSITSAIAWRTRNPNGMKIIVPTDEGAKLITIPLKEA